MMAGQNEELNKGFAMTLPSLKNAKYTRDLNRKHRRQLGSTRWRKMREKQIAMAEALGLA